MDISGDRRAKKYSKTNVLCEKTRIYFPQNRKKFTYLPIPPTTHPPKSIGGERDATMADEQETKPDAVETKEEDEGEKKEEATTPSFAFLGTTIAGAVAKDEEEDGEEKPPNPTKEGGEEAVEAAESTATFEPVVSQMIPFFICMYEYIFRLCVL